MSEDGEKWIRFFFPEKKSDLGKEVTLLFKVGSKFRLRNIFYRKRWIYNQNVDTILLDLDLIDHILEIIQCDGKGLQ